MTVMSLDPAPTSCSESQFPDPGGTTWNGSLHAALSTRTAAREYRRFITNSGLKIERRDRRSRLAAAPQACVKPSLPSEPRAGIDLAHAPEHHDAEMNALDLRPVAFQRTRLECDRRATRDAGRRWHERREPVVYHAPQRDIDTLQQMPQGDRILRARQREHVARRARSRPPLLEIERDYRAHERRRRVIDVRRPRTGRTDLHQGAQRHAGGARSGLELHFPARDVQQSLAEGIGLERVCAAEVDRGARRCLDEKEAWHGVDLGIARSARVR